MKNKTIKKSKNFTIFLILSSLLLMSGPIQMVSAEDLNRVSGYTVSLSITPSHIEENSNVNPIGYVYISGMKLNLFS